MKDRWNYTQYKISLFCNFKYSNKITNVINIQIKYNSIYFKVMIFKLKF
jgi:hypothetical protein